MNGVTNGGQSLAGWALEVYASGRGKQVSVEPPAFSPDSHLPIVGFERNEPFRRVLGQRGLELPVSHLNPGVVYHSRGRSLVRPSSVEGWIEAGSEWFSGAGFREFWENVWNLSVAAWNFVDEFGLEPTHRPAGFPYFHPSFWQGFKRNQLLFAKVSAYLESFDVEPRAEFHDFVDSQIRFAYGRGLEQVSLGSAALILNAPSISYALAGGTAEPNPTPKSTGQSVPATAWRAGFRAGSELQTDTVHQVFLEGEVGDPTSGAVVLTLGKAPKGFLYFRSDRRNVEGLARALDRALGEGWGDLERDEVRPLSGLAYAAGGRTYRTEAEAEWPWLGPARAYLEARRPLV